MNVKLTLKSLWLAVMLTVATAAMAQTKVTGIVYEPDGTTPVIGATVVQTGTNKVPVLTLTESLRLQSKARNLC